MNSKRILAVICLLSLPAALMNAGDIVKDTTDFDRNVASSPAELLKGEISGVRVSSLDGNPNGAFNVNIRGLNTLRGDSQPMWIVDGAVIGSSVNHNLNAFYLNGDITINGDLLPDYSGRSYTAPVGNFRWLNPYEIESIEIVKDMSQAAIYGMQGANGVIIVKTRKASSDKRSIRLSSNVGVNFSTQDGEAFRTGINHMHDIGINGMFGSNSWYSISGFLHQNTGAVKRTDSMVGGLAVSMETMANRLFHFGFNSFLSYGDLLSTGGTNHIGAPSTMVLSRHPDAFTDDTVSGWLSDYDDRVRDYRTVNSVWLKINFLKILGLKLTGGMDYQNQTRYIWFGPGTSFGKEYSGAAGILNNSLCTYNFKGELDFNMNFSVRHSVHASLAFDMNGNLNRTNAMCGTDFGMPYLRSKGLSSSGSLHAIRKFSRDYNETGAYLTLGYGFNGYAGINGTVRYDYNSRFDQEPTIFPAADAFVDFKRIFLKDSRTVSSLKLSGGWGSAGKETVLPYEYLDFWIYGVPDVDAGTENYYDGVNRLISREYNVGIEAGLVDGRFSFALKYYDKETGEELTQVIAKMSKSLKNVINPDDFIKNYGADSVRMYEMFMGPLRESKPWATNGFIGVYRFLDRIWRISTEKKIEDIELTPEIDSLMHKTIKKVTEDTESLSFNTAISQMMVFVNELNKLEVVPKKAMENLTLLLSPYTPHLAEELWVMFGHEPSVANEKWPEYDVAKTIDATIEVVVQVNGKLRARLQMPQGASKEEMLNEAKNDEKIKTWIEGKEIVKEIVVPNKLVNIVVK